MNAINKLQDLVATIKAEKGEDSVELKLGSCETGTVAIPVEYATAVEEILKDELFTSVTKEVVFGTPCYGFYTVNSEELTRQRLAEICEDLGFTEMSKCLKARIEPADDNAVAIAQSIVAGTIFAAEAGGSYKSAKATLQDANYVGFITSNLNKHPTIKADIKEVMKLVHEYTARFLSVLPE